MAEKKKTAKKGTSDQFGCEAPWDKRKPTVSKSFDMNPDKERIVHRIVEEQDSRSKKS